MIDRRGVSVESLPDVDPWGALPGDPHWLDVDALDLCTEDIEACTADQCLETLASVRRLRARADAIEAQTLARFHQVRGGVRGTADEAALELRTTRRVADRRVDHAEQLVGRHRRVLVAMHAGHLEGYAAGRIIDVTEALDDDQARDVDVRLAGQLTRPGANPSDLRRAARRHVLAVDPDGQHVRASKARAGRKVELLPGEDATSTLIADLPAETASAVYGSIDSGARTARRAGDPRTLDQLRADILADRILGGDGSRGAPTVSAHVMIHMPVDAALAISDHGCQLDGYGPIPGPIARHIMGRPDSIWRKVICDTGTGQPMDLGRTRYRPTLAIRDLVTVHDRECVVPGCHRAALTCDYDHARSAARGGDTSADNGQPVCEYHNNLKEEPGWQLATDHPSSNTATISTPSGRKYHAHHHPVWRPKPPPTRDPAPETLPEDPPVITQDIGNVSLRT